MRATTGGSGGEFPVLDEGGYAARIYSIVDIGMQETKFGLKQQIIITWELPSELSDEGLPHAISKFYTLSLNEKANLRKDLESMKGKIPAEKLEDPVFIDNLFTKLLGTTCQLSISQYKNKEGYNRNGIEGVGKLMKGTDVPAAVNTPVLLDLENYDQSVYDALPEWQQTMIDVGKPVFDAQMMGDTVSDDGVPMSDNLATEDEADW